MVKRATMESKTEGTMWKSIKNCVRNRCQKWPCILFGVNYQENKQWTELVDEKTEVQISSLDEVMFRLVIINQKFFPFG